MREYYKVKQVFLDTINQIFEIEKKISQIQEPNSVLRNINKLKEIIEEDLFSSEGEERIGFSYHNPIGEKYNDTRTDCDASIAGNRTDELVITDVIKPIIYLRTAGVNRIVQKAIVIVESNPEPVKP